MKKQRQTNKKGYDKTLKSEYILGSCSFFKSQYDIPIIDNPSLRSELHCVGRSPSIENEAWEMKDDLQDADSESIFNSNNTNGISTLLLFNWIDFEIASGVS